MAFLLQQPLVTQNESMFGCSSPKQTLSVALLQKGPGLP